MVTASIDRPNSALAVLSRSGMINVTATYDAVLIPLLTEVVAHGKNVPKTGVFFQQLSWLSYAYTVAIRPDKDGKPSQVRAFVAQYHKLCTPEVSCHLKFQYSHVLGINYIQRYRYDSLRRFNSTSVVVNCTSILYL